MRAPMSSSFNHPRFVAATVVVTALLVGISGGAGGDRTHNRGIMRWEQSVELVRRGRIRPGFSASIVRWCWIRPVVLDWYVG
jgi:hypothetical protein